MPSFLLKNVLFLAFLCILLTQCRHKPHRVTTAFYHWRTTLAWSAAMQTYTEQARVSTIYLRVLDVDWLEGELTPSPVANFTVVDSIPSSVAIIPVIFLTNRTFEQITAEQIPILAQNIAQQTYNWTAHAQQIQFDCDWTQATRARYFAFLEACRTQFKTTISATVRLHQVKYLSQTGIPPVTRGLLMAYNTGDLDDPTAQNTILELSVLRQYLGQLSAYPLPLDVALPVFSWGVLYRDGRAIRLFYPLNALDFEQEDVKKIFVKNPQSRFYELQQNAYFRGQYLYADDQIRLESVNATTLKTAAEMLAPLIRNDSLSVAFFQLDSATMQHFEPRILKTIVRAFE